MKEEILKNICKYKKAIIITILLTLLITFTFFIYLNQTKKEKIKIEPIIEKIKEEPKEEVEEELKTQKIKVDIKGEVNTPGVYELNEGDRVIHAINASGGLTEKADTSLINLSKNLTDEMVVIIYNKDIIGELKKEELKTETIVKYIEKECTCPDSINDACINKSEEETLEENSEQSNNKVSINTASIEELTTIPGIGETKAKSIIEHREENGLFKTIEDLMNVKGIGESTFEKLKSYITI